MNKEIEYKRGTQDFYSYSVIRLTKKERKILVLFGKLLVLGILSLFLVGVPFYYLGEYWGTFFSILILVFIFVCGFIYDFLGGYEAEQRKKVKQFECKKNYIDFMNIKTGKIRRVYVQELKQGVRN